MFCGLFGWHPKSLQKFANTKTFLLVYGLLGTMKSMAFVYFFVTLTTLEKRFKIPSQTTGEQKKKTLQKNIYFIIYSGVY